MTKKTASALCSGHEDNLAVCSLELPEGIPEWVHLLPLGAIKAADGRGWTNDDPEKVVKASLVEIDLVIDYEHQTDKAEKNGQKAIAAGWIKQMEVRKDGIWGQVEWTETAAEHLRNKEYRYLSPTFMFAKKGGKKIVKILRAALVNAPAIHTLTALAKEDRSTLTMDKFLKALAAALGLPEEATEEMVMAKLSELSTTALAADASAATITAICKALKLDDGADADTITTALAKYLEEAGEDEGGEPDPSQYVSMASFQDISGQLKVMQDELATDKATSAVDKALADGKVAPAQKEWATSYAKKDLDGFTSYVEKQPVLVAPGSTQPAKRAPGNTVLTAEEKAICANTGVSEADYLATCKSEEEAVH